MPVFHAGGFRFYVGRYRFAGGRGRIFDDVRKDFTKHLHGNSTRTQHHRRIDRKIYDGGFQAVLAGSPVKDQRDLTLQVFINMVSRRRAGSAGRIGTGSHDRQPGPGQQGHG